MNNDQDREIRTLKRKLEIAEKNYQEIKSERSKALNMYHDESALRAKLESKIKDLSSCEHCNETQEQYEKIRSAFDRKKSQHQAITEYLKQNNLILNGKKLSLTCMIKNGKILLKMQE